MAAKTINDVIECFFHYEYAISLPIVYGYFGEEAYDFEPLPMIQELNRIGMLDTSYAGGDEMWGLKYIVREKIKKLSEADKADTYQFFIKEYEKPLIPATMTNDLFNRVVMVLYKKTMPVPFAAISYEIQDSSLNILEMEEELDRIGILIKNQGQRRKVYALSHQARKSIDTMPDEYYKRPYDFFLSSDFLPDVKPIAKPATQKRSRISTTIQKVGLWIISHIGEFILLVLAAIVATYLIYKLNIPH